MICWVLAMQLLQGVWKQHLRLHAVVGYGVKIFLPSPPNYVTRSPGTGCRYIGSVSTFQRNWQLTCTKQLVLLDSWPSWSSVIHSCFCSPLSQAWMAVTCNPCPPTSANCFVSQVLWVFIPYEKPSLVNYSQVVVSLQSCKRWLPYCFLDEVHLECYHFTWQVWVDLQIAVENSYHMVSLHALYLELVLVAIIRVEGERPWSSCINQESLLHLFLPPYKWNMKIIEHIGMG